MQNTETPLPPQVQAAVDEAMRAMLSHARHHLFAYYRLQIYLALNDFNSQPATQRPRVPTLDNVGDRARGWLAILAAERVLPIFEQGVISPDDNLEEDRKLPAALLAMAKNLMQGSVSPEEVDQANMEVHGADQEIALWLKWTPPAWQDYEINAVLAGQASQRALGEVLGWYRLEDLTGYGDRHWLQNPDDMLTDWHKRWASEELIDERFAYTGSDTAASAAVASACSATSRECNPERLQEFWTWWLTDALPRTWQMAADENPGFASR